jgi:uncharacterized lipoprotein YajG
MSSAIQKNVAKKLPCRRKNVNVGDLNHMKIKTLFILATTVFLFAQTNVNAQSATSPTTTQAQLNALVEKVQARTPRPTSRTNSKVSTASSPARTARRPTRRQKSFT